MVRGWVVALVVVGDVLPLVLLLTTALASTFSDRLAEQRRGRALSGPFPLGYFSCRGLGASRRWPCLSTS